MKQPRGTMRIRPPLYRCLDCRVEWEQRQSRRPLTCRYCHSTRLRLVRRRKPLSWKDISNGQA